MIDIYKKKNHCICLSCRSGDRFQSKSQMVKNDIVFLLSGCYPCVTLDGYHEHFLFGLVFRLFLIREENDDTYERERKVKNPFYSNSLIYKTVLIKQQI